MGFGNTALEFEGDLTEIALGLTWQVARHLAYYGWTGEAQLLQHLFDMAEPARAGQLAILPAQPISFKCGATGRQLGYWEAYFAGAWPWWRRPLCPPPW